MKKIALLVGLLMLSAGCHRGTAPVLPPPNKDWTITIAMTYDFTNFVPCSASVTKGCITGFTWGFFQGSTFVPLKTSPASICSGTTQPESCTDTANSTLGIGSVVFAAFANGIDNAGVSVTSGQSNTTSTTVSLLAPVVVSVTTK